MNVFQASQWIHSLRRFGIKPGLERTKNVLTTFGNPEASLRFYHVAGTNGKGSVCAMLDSMLRVAGLRVGLFTSPGFGGLTGRMTVNGDAISEDLFAAYAGKIKTVMEKQELDDPLTEFEVLTVIALIFFHAQQVNAVVWETGMGGRYDSTNVVQPVVTAITNVSLDHVAVLGPTISRIAYDKAGIVKPGVPVVTGADETAYRVIEDVAQQIGAPVLRVGRDVELTGIQNHLEARRLGFYRGIDADRGNIEVSLFGRHQLVNAAVALAMFELGEKRPWQLSAAARALQQVRWPLRFEVFWDRHHRPIVVDGAHNVGAARVLAEALVDFSRIHRLTEAWDMVIGVLADKDASDMLEHVLPYASRVLVCQPNHARALDANDLAEKVRRFRADLPVEVIPNVDQATAVMLQRSNPVVVWGSLYMVEDARKTITTMGIDYWTRGR